MPHAGRRLLALIVLGACSSLTGLAQEEPSPPAPSPQRQEAIDRITEAQGFLLGKKWKKAEKAFREITEEQPDFALGWMGLGLALDGQDRPEEAVEAYKAAAATGSMVGQATYNAACAYARMNRLDDAIVWLRKSLDLGLTNLKMLETDPDLDNVRRDPRFIEIVIGAGGSACLAHERYRALDFWVGNWDVAGSGAAGSGRRFVVSKGMESCLLTEVELEASGVQDDLAFLYFDPGLDKWRYEVLRPDGAIGRWVGGVSDGVASFEGEWTHADGKREKSRVTIAPDGEGRLRRTEERSRDQGATWSRDVLALTHVDTSAVKARLEPEENTCRSDPRRDALRRWLGNGNLVGADGVELASSTWAPTLNGCVLLGRWAPAEGDHMLYWTYLDPATGEWIRNGISETGDLVHATGARKGDEFVFEGERIGWDGSKKAIRSTRVVSAEGALKERIERSDDGGRTWSLEVDGTYVEAKPEKGGSR